MNDYENILKKIAGSISAFDAIVILCRQQQIELGKIVSIALNIKQDDLLKSLKDSSLEALKKHGLDY